MMSREGHYVSVAIGEYRGTFVKLVQLLDVAKSASRASARGSKRKLSALDEFGAMNGKQVVFWDAHRDQMLKPTLVYDEDAPRSS